MKITKVLGSRILVRNITPEVPAGTDDGIVVAPQSVNPNYFQGEVLAIGPDIKMYIVGQDGKQSEPQHLVTVGDKVAYVKYGYEDMGDELHLVEENSLLAVYE